MSALECPPTPPTLPEGEAAITPPPKSAQPVDDELPSRTNESRRPSSPDPSCAICLGHLENMSYTDACFHKFCFVCLVEWSKVKPVCPLCKAKFKNIIHNIKSDDTYEQYRLPPPPPRVDIGILVDEDQEEVRRFRYRTTLPQYGDRVDRLQMLEDNALRLRQIEATMNHWRDQLPTMLPSRSEPARASARSLWTRRRGAATSEFRRDIYRRNLYVDPESISDITGRYRDCSPAWYRTNPAQTHRLVPWLNRELNALLEGSEHQSAYVTTKILQLIERFDIGSPEFHEKLLPYLSNRTDHFQHEFYHFARSVYDMIGYDRNATYTENNQLATELVSSENSDGDDVQVVEEVRAPTTSSEGIPSILDMGPSTSSGISSSAGGSLQRLVIPSSDSSSDSDANDAKRRGSEGNNDDIEVVGFVKPRHERTPVIINLSSEDEAQPLKSEAIPSSSKENEMIEISSSSESNHGDTISQHALFDVATARAEIRRILDADRFARRRIMSLFKEVKDRAQNGDDSEAQSEGRENQSSSIGSTSTARHSETTPSQYKGKGKGKGKSSQRVAEADTSIGGDHGSHRQEEHKKKKKSKKKKRPPSKYENDASSEGDSLHEPPKKSKHKKKSKKKKKKQQAEGKSKKLKKKKSRVISSSSSSFSSASSSEDDKPLSKWKVSKSSRSERPKDDLPQANPSSSSTSTSGGGPPPNEDLRLFLSRKRPTRCWSSSDSSNSDCETRPRKKVRSVVLKVDTDY